MKSTRISTILLLIGCSVGALAVGCGDDTLPQGGGGAGAGGEATAGAAAGGGGAGAGGGSSALDIDWVPCAESSDEPSGDDAECATIPVPVDWNDPDGPTIDFFVKKLPAATQPARGQLWLLNGGPGYSGADFEGMFKAQTLDIYLPDHRGTGRSSRLGCEPAEADDSPGGFQVLPEEMPDCVPLLEAEWGEKLDGFTVTNAARDVGEVIRATRAPDEALLFYGASYGTIWANRFLQIYPSDADGVVLDAFALGLDFADDDIYFNELGEKWMDACGQDATCAEKLGPDPWATMTDALDAFDAGSCPGIAALGFDRPTLHMFWSFFYYTWDLRSLVAPMVYRLERCEDRDVAAYEALVAAFSGGGEPTAAQRYFSMMLLTHIALSEMWEEPVPTVEELEAYEASANVAHGLSVPERRVYDAWPRYPRDEYSDGLADVTTPLLIMHGEYDFIPADVIASPVAHFDGEHHSYFEIPNAPHGTAAAPQVGGGQTCSSQLFSQFIAEPTAALDASCTAGVAPLPLDVPNGLAGAVFGTTDEWDGTPQAAIAPPSPEQVTELETVRTLAARYPWRLRLPQRR